MSTMNIVMDGGTPVFVTVIHRIHDPKGFQEAEAKGARGRTPDHCPQLPIHAGHPRSPTWHLHLGKANR